MVIISVDPQNNPRNWAEQESWFPRHVFGCMRDWEIRYVISSVHSCLYSWARSVARHWTSGTEDPCLTGGQSERQLQPGPGAAPIHSLELSLLFHCSHPDFGCHIFYATQTWLGCGKHHVKWCTLSTQEIWHHEGGCMIKGELWWHWSGSDGKTHSALT